MSDLKDHEVVGFVLKQLHKQFPQPPVPVEAIDTRLAIWKASGMYEELSAEDWALIGKEVKAQVKITMDPGETLKSNAWVDWLPERHADIDWRRWVAYKQMLTGKGFTPTVLASLDESTNEIVNCLGDPTVAGSWKRRGLVIGDVQSGKTATYLGAVNKAADAGYRLIVLLAGGTEALRKQTQFRVDEGLIGRDSSKAHSAPGMSINPVIGVGNFLPNDYVSAQGLTTQAADFRKNSKQATNIVVDAKSPTPLVFVLKKNKTALSNLRDWLESQRYGGAPLDIPMLLVDDESDYASVNTKDGADPTVINSLIRSVLSQVSRSSYLAFTATPFANVFIDHETESEVLGDDLFPSDYICTLDAPTNYVGSSAYFGTEDVVDNTRLVPLDDAQEHFPLKHKSQHVVTGLPHSLEEAVRAFVVASAIREARGDSSPRAMLINVSRFKSVQAQVHELVVAHFETIKHAIELYATNLAGGEHEQIAVLRHVFESHFSGTGPSWSEVQPFLKNAVHGTSVRLINSDRVKKVDSLDDLETERMIAVGGDVLSRGLTLEGLTVSYFHRSVGASDTLLQMARWFGYRPGYDDLCRVWIPDEGADQFRYVAGIVDELRGQLRAMKKQGLTPKEFGLAVRMHPEALLITARNKMKAAEAKSWTIDIAGKKNLETVKVDASAKRIMKNFQAAQALAKEVDPGNSAWEVEGIPFPAKANVDKQVVAAFLEGYVPFAGDALFGDSTLANFIAKATSARLQSWLVGFVTGSGGEVKLTDSLTLPKAVQRAVKAGIAVQLPGATKPSVPFRVSGSSARLAGSTDVWRATGLDGKALTEPGVYEVLPYPVLLVYIIEPKVAAEDLATRSLLSDAQTGGAQYLVGIKIGIPGKPGEKGPGVKYLLNSVALQSWIGATIEDSDDEAALGDVDGSDDD